MTPSDVEQALSSGSKLLKFFPAEVAGGVAMLKALAGPYAHTGVKFIPTGGVSSGNLAEYLKLPVVAAIGGSWMVDKQLVNDGKWAEITRITREALAAAAAAR
jgi:2-dehydro-3-deoxyphosphogluconate aldolase/(4S)-4-hydroxy-2-oxoglutarate aldolase